MRFGRIVPLAFTVVPAVAFGCLDRPVVHIEPSSNSVSVQRLRATRIEKVDLLLVVDSSSSMRDKQSELGRRIPELIAGLTTPSIDPETGRQTRVYDVHVAVISSSLGSHGTGMCHTGWYGPHSDDRAHLLPRAGDPAPKSGWKIDAAGNPVEAACPPMVAGRPLTWVADAARDPAARFVGNGGAADLQAAASCVVASVEDDGCGFEATWESVHRFLVDPAPYTSAKVSCALPSTPGPYACSGGIAVQGLDTELLAQRKAFLREDSLLAVVVLSDENDFSLRPEGRNWKPWGVPQTKMPRAWGGCANVPDDVEPDDEAGLRKLLSDWGCRSCEDDPSDPSCAQTWPSADGDSDAWNLRGFHQVQRFGWNALWGRGRYVDAFRALQIKGSDGRLASNPLFAGGKRSDDMIVVAGIVGVPQELVTDEKGLPKKLGDADWEKMISPDLGRRDRHMIESFLPRPGLPAYAGDRGIDPVSGGERVIKGKDDLQYACIAKRTTTAGGDDCLETPTYDPATNPLCDGDRNQPYFKAYPGLRHLRVLHDLGDRGFVSSICAESYQPAIRGIADRIRLVVDGQCIRSDVKPDASGAVGCFNLESFAESTHDGVARCEDIGKGYCTPGAAPCRVEGSDYPPLAPEMAAAQLALPITVTGADGAPRTQTTPATFADGNVYVEGKDGKRHLVCEMMQLAGGRAPDADLQACLHDEKLTTPSTGGGWCYTTDPKVLGSHCVASGAPGKMRFLGDVEPKNGSEVFTVCIGK
ncbi:MAG: hypothetical protein HYV09_29115 [Deltaproteobacteria bacterium]|nr:hypothetical protein [Deltaproteobacteria bacterium]